MSEPITTPPGIPPMPGVKRPPGPRTLSPLSSASALQREPIRFALEIWQRYGDVVRFRFLFWPAYVFYHPDHPAVGAHSRSVNTQGPGTGEYLSIGQIGSIRCPGTCLEGTLSPRFYHAASLRLAKILPQAQLQTVAGAGYLLFFDQPGGFVQAVSGAAAGYPFPS